jgi:hypothetical protein
MEAREPREVDICMSLRARRSFNFFEFSTFYADPKLNRSPLPILKIRPKLMSEIVKEELHRLAIISDNPSNDLIGIQIQLLRFDWRKA